MIKCWYLSFLLFISYLSIAQNREIDSLQKIVNTSKVDTVKLQALSDLNWACMIADVVKSKGYALQELSLAKKIGHQRFIAQAYNDMGSSFIRLGMPDSALDVLNRSLIIRKTLQDKNLLASSLSKIAMVYHSLGKYKEALDIEFEALKTYVLLKNPNNEARILNNIGATYQRLNDSKKAIEYIDQAIAIYNKNNIESELGSSYFNKGNNLLDLQDFEKAQEIFLKALFYFKKINDRQGESYVYSAMGLIEKHNKNFNIALDNFRKAYKLSLEENNQLDLLLTRQQLVSMLIDTKNYVEAKKLAVENAAEISSDIKPRLLENYKQLAIIYAVTNQGELSKTYMEKFSALKDSIYSSSTAEEIAIAEKKYESEKKENENQLLKQKNSINLLEIETNQQKIKTKNATIFILIGFILLIALSVVWLINVNNLKKKNRELEATQAVQKEKERISRDLHDNVGGQLSYVLYSIDDIANDDKQKRVELSGKMNESIRAVISSLRETIWAINDEEISMNDFSDKLKVYARNMFKNTDTQLIYSENITINTSLNSFVGLNLYRICQEIINNSFKHANASTINISLATGEKTTIIISDNGVGFSTDQEHSNSYGLSNINSRAKESEITIDIKASINNGTSYTLVV